MQEIPVITIDGPSGTGKGTVSDLLAKELGFHFLDSGALYRLLALAAEHHAIPLSDEVALATLAGHLDIQFIPDEDETCSTRQVLLEGERVTDLIRSEECGKSASIVAVLPSVRNALLSRQRVFRELPGLVADGRDMGTVVFPDATLKIFLTATAEERTRRRHKQLMLKGNDVSICDLLREIELRDRRDSERAVAPLKPATDAVVVDTTTLSVQAVLVEVRALWWAKTGRHAVVSSI